VISESSGKNNRFRFYLYCRQQGLWPKEVTGHDPDQEPKTFDAWCPIRNVSASCPPTLLVHGTKDTDVPNEQSPLMAQELSRKGVELITVPDAGHGLSGAKPEVVAGIHDTPATLFSPLVRALLPQKAAAAKGFSKSAHLLVNGRKPFDIKVPHFYHLSQSYKIKIRERFWGVAGTEFSRILTTYIVEGLAMYSVVLMAA
jgi:hypothetical protein